MHTLGNQRDVDVLMPFALAAEYAKCDADQMLG